MLKTISDNEGIKDLAIRYTTSLYDVVELTRSITGILRLQGVFFFF